MEKIIKLKGPQIKDEFIYVDDVKVVARQDGFKNDDVKRFHISELSLKEAEDYSELYKQEFMRKYHESLK